MNNIQGCAISSVMDLFDGAVEEEKQRLQDSATKGRV